jgi:hypothetical protein
MSIASKRPSIGERNCETRGVSPKLVEVPLFQLSIVFGDLASVCREFLKQPPCADWAKFRNTSDRVQVWSVLLDFRAT